MRETGIVTKIEAGAAQVRIERRGTTGGCCQSEYTEQVLRTALIGGTQGIEIKVNDTVTIESNAVSEKFRDTMQCVIALFVFLLALTCFSHLGTRLFTSLVFSTAMSALSIGITQIIYRKNPLPPNRILDGQ